MYKITVHFKSNIIGVYTKEEETATDMEKMKEKKHRMINRWFEIICPHINFSHYINNILCTRRLFEKNTIITFDYSDEMDKIKIDLIEQTLDEMDMFDELITGEEAIEETKRKFTFKVEEI